MKINKKWAMAGAVVVAVLTGLNGCGSGDDPSSKTSIAGIYKCKNNCDSPCGFTTISVNLEGAAENNEVDIQGQVSSSNSGANPGESKCVGTVDSEGNYQSICENDPAETCYAIFTKGSLVLENCDFENSQCQNVTFEQE